MRTPAGAKAGSGAPPPQHAAALQSVVWQLAPRVPARLKTPARLSRFKCAQREFDQVWLDPQIASPAEVQARNSIAQANRPVQLLNFEHAQAAPV